jgi:hypothetical protein
MDITYPKFPSYVHVAVPAISKQQKIGQFEIHYNFKAPA